MEHVELYIKIKLRNGASCWFLSYEYITMDGPQNQWRNEGGVWGGFNTPPRNSKDIGGVLHTMSKKNRRLDFFL